MDEIEFGLSRDAYNTFVQLVQSEAASFGMEHRVRATHHECGRIDGALEVFWGQWHELGAETDAMTPECHRVIYPNEWEDIKAQAAYALLTS